MTAEEARQTLAEADLICSAEDIQAAIGRIAGEVTARLEREHPLVLSAMVGALYFAGQLLPRLRFPLECDYIHATRYRNTTQGHGIEWVIEPRTPVTGRSVLLLDDILDEGVTLLAMKERLLAQGAQECLTAVLTEKDLGHKKGIAADFVGVTLPNRYVFGCGMDVKGAWRNLPAVYAVKGL
jgi:hypoxanthine phosphoribosyltransferase